MPLFFSGVLLTYMLESPAKKDARTPEKPVTLDIGLFPQKFRFFLT
jgi:hypothetical protein